MGKVQRYGWIPQAKDHRDYRLTDPHAPALLPAKFSLRTDPVQGKFMPEVYDQGNIGSCTANAIAAAYEFELKFQKEDFMPSRLYIYYKEREIEGTVDQDSGANLRDGLKAVSQGVCPEADWPYDTSTFAGPVPYQATGDAFKSKALEYYHISSNSPGAPLRACLAKAKKPFVFGWPVPAAFESQEFANGWRKVLWLPGPNEQFVGGHATVATGYDWTMTRFPVPVFEVRNSWGPDWCDHGYFYMDYRWFDVNRGLADDLWTIRRTT